MKKILLPTDFSDNARNAVEYAISMFGYENVQYILLNSFAEPHTTADIMVSISDLMQKESKRELRNEMEYLNNKFPRELLNIEEISEYGQLAYVINRMVEAEKIDYVVMGTKGASGLKKVFAGSNTADVVKKVKCPVLAIPEKAKYEPPVRIAFAADYEALADQYLLSPLKELVEQYQSELMVVNIQPEGELVDAEQAAGGVRLHHTLQAIPHTFLHVEHKNIAEGISHFIIEHKVDMLVMVGHQHGVFERIFRSSVTRQMSMLTKVPLMVLHEK